MPLFNNRQRKNGSMVNLGHVPSNQQREKNPYGISPQMPRKSPLSDITSKKPTIASKLKYKVGEKKQNARLSAENTARTNARYSAAKNASIQKQIKERKDSEYKARQASVKPGVGVSAGARRK